MATMMVIATTSVPLHLKGALSRWTIEVAPGVFVGTTSKRVREQLWDLTQQAVADGAAVLIHTAANEQGFSIKTAGERRRRPEDFDGLTLVRFVAQSPDPDTTSAESEWPTDF
ncbi:type I-E CRISPR-associated endoribonuclease Cas2e [Glycomyces sambucus]|uniref:type I-E CRISPR-associated endoribonuclease Cas2e n=1 Tax=Glycomyces sambucus TaxID=380244 RepID=UPI000A846EAA|nr:type I-E CRISPR-associated endoribonuclease Cas2e [Glycomyces sambucus]